MPLTFGEIIFRDRGNVFLLRLDLLRTIETLGYLSLAFGTGSGIRCRMTQMEELFGGFYIQLERPVQVTGQLSLRRCSIQCLNSR